MSFKPFFNAFTVLLSGSCDCVAAVFLFGVPAAQCPLGIAFMPTAPFSRRLTLGLKDKLCVCFEASQVLFRFLYGGQLADPSLIIHIDDVGWSAVSECFVETLVIPPVHPVQGRPFDFGA